MLFVRRMLVSIIALTIAVPALIITRAQDSQPQSVTIAGTIQSKLGCATDWDPACDKTNLAYDESSDVWKASFELEPGNYEYKVALNGSWDENYGAKAERNGPNIALDVAAKTTVKFVYSHATHWVADSRNFIIANVPGSFQSEIGCPDDWQPWCLRTWLQDPDGDGVYTYTASGIPQGDYEAKVAINETWGENYGAQGARDGANIGFSAPGNKEVIFSWDSQSKQMSIEVAGAPKGNLRLAQAHWLTRDTIAWMPRVKDPALLEGATYTFHYDPNAGLVLAENGVQGGEAFPLIVDADGLGEPILAKFPHLKGLQALKLSAEAAVRAQDLLKGQIAVSVAGKDGALLDATGLQIPGVLDNVYSYRGELGVSVANGIPTIRVWGPTARSVRFHLFADSKPETAGEVSEMAYDAASGVWSIEGAADWMGKFYLFEVEVYAPTTGAIERNLVTDPYSISLAMNSTRSQIVDLRDPALAPTGWGILTKPTIPDPVNTVIYELHIRDFSIYDQTVPEEFRGTYKAFTVAESDGMKHLAALAGAGLTHVHLLPFFDIATINEDKSQRREILFDIISRFGPDAENPQELINRNRARDGFNWGYDPYHFGTPEGSYSTDPDGSRRILELREAIKALNASGLRVVMDVVYNHTNASGQNEKSVLDKVVPGYYHRLSADGKVERSTCCENTATEHRMMEKLMIDTLLIWAREYKIDGFRFDLMGHHMKYNMENVRRALDSLTLDKDGVDGKAIYVYGEGWNFGEVQNNQRGVNATQINLAGTGIGTFNDRLRDSARGGSPFGGQQEQGFINGLFDNPNTTNQGRPDEQKARLLLFADRIRVGLAGNLKDYRFINREGNTVTGKEIDYNGAPTGYTASPRENIVYVSKHDNETVFDLIQFKAPLETPMATRVRMQNMGASIVLLSQGVPFFQAGDDILRSKSFDKDSYDSGDWFNAIDWSLNTTNWGRGLPIADKNRDLWPVMKPLLANPALKPTKADMQRANAHFREMLAIRASSGLFRLQTAEEIQQALVFYNVGPEQVPGLIVMALTAPDPANVAGDYRQIVVIFNATRSEQTFSDPTFADSAFVLHPVQAASDDEIVKASKSEDGRFTVPAYTTAVFVVRK